MSETERELEHRQDLQFAPPTGGDVATCISHLLHALSETKIPNADLRQLWLETHWIKSDYEQGILVVPVGWELMIYQIGRGQSSPAIKRHPKVVRAAADLAQAIRDEIKNKA